MTSRRVMSVVLMLFVAALACSPGGGGPLPVTDTPSPKPTKTTRAPTEVVPTEQSAEPTATRPPKATSTPGGGTGSCSAFKATSDVAWVTLDSSGNIDQQVSSYPD